MDILYSYLGYLCYLTAIIITYSMYKFMINILIAIIVITLLWSIWGFFGSRVEQTDYKVTRKMNSYEIREYPEHIVAQATVEGSP